MLISQIGSVDRGTFLAGILAVTACAQMPSEAPPEEKLEAVGLPLTSYTDHALFRENFEDEALGTAWGRSLLRVQRYTTGGIEGRILRATYDPSERGSRRITRNFRLERSVAEATLSFDVKLHSRFDFQRGGKMHGLGGGSRTTGCNPIDPRGWSVRMMWRSEGVPELYVYGQDRTNRCGDSYRHDGSFRFERGTWYRIDLHVRLNSRPERADGMAALYVDAQRVAWANDLRLTGDADTWIDTFMFNTFHGGSDWSWAPDHQTYAYFDNFTVHPGMRISGWHGTTCEIFREGVYHAGRDVCCAEECGSCGGGGCSGLPGGAQSCCTGHVVQSTKDCDTQGTRAPCAFW